MFMDPVQTLQACNIQSSASIANFGVGGALVAESAATLVPLGQVFAIEVNKDVVTRITRDADERHLKNLHALWADVETKEGSKLSEGSMDIVLCLNLLFLLDDKAAVVKEAYRVLKPGGRLLITDWTESFGGLGPRPHHIFNKEMAQTLATTIGFKKRVDSIPSGEHHYGILFEK